MARNSRCMVENLPLYGVYTSYRQSEIPYGMILANYLIDC